MSWSEPCNNSPHHYVVTKGEIGMPPQKKGPIGHIPVVAYKSFCAGFATFHADQSVELHGRGCEPLREDGSDCCQDDDGRR
jgi:hypothetical protein